MIYNSISGKFRNIYRNFEQCSVVKIHSVIFSKLRNLIRVFSVGLKIKDLLYIDCQIRNYF